MTIRLRPADHVTVICEHYVEAAPRTTCYGQVLAPVRLDFSFCQHSDRGSWEPVAVDIVGHVMTESAITATHATAQYIAGPRDEDDPEWEPIPLWVQPLLDQVKADLDRRERLA